MDSPESALLRECARLILATPASVIAQIWTVQERVRLDGSIHGIQPAACDVLARAIERDPRMREALNELLIQGASLFAFSFLAALDGATMLADTNVYVLSDRDSGKELAGGLHERLFEFLPD